MFKKKSPLKSTRLAKRKRRIRIITASMAVISGALVLFGLSWLSKNIFMIRSVEVRGNSAVEADDIAAVAESHIAGTYVHLFSKSNKFLYPKDMIETDLLARFKRLETVSLETSGDKLGVVVTERRPSYVWCPGQAGRNNGTGCYFLDERGYIFSEAPTFSGNVFFVFYGNVSTMTPIGLSYLPVESFKNVDRLIVFIDSRGLDPIALTARGRDVYELSLSKGGKIIFRGGDFELLKSNIDAVIRNTTILSPSGLSKLEYVDFRFGNKVYYKTKGDNAAQLP